MALSYNSEQLQVVQIPLSKAVVCVDCNTVNNSPGENCCVCGSPSLMNLAVWLDREQEAVAA